MSNVVRRAAAARLYSIGKDSSVMVRLAQKAFYPGPIPFPLLHVDTTYKFKEMIEFRDKFVAELGVKLIVHSNTAALEAGANPYRLGTERCCGLLKTQSLLDALREGNYDAAFGGARRDEEKSRAKERIFSLPRQAGPVGSPKNQRPELWNLFNSRVEPGESIRVFPLSNWTELDVYLAVHSRGEHPHRSAVLRQGPEDAGAREVVDYGGTGIRSAAAGRAVRMGAMPDAIAGMFAVYRRHSIPDADTLPKIIAELVAVRNSERENRVIDHDREGSMELKKREGYF